MKEIELPDGSIAEFPDEMSDDDIAGVLRNQYGSPTESDIPSMPDSAVPDSIPSSRGMLERSYEGIGNSALGLAKTAGRGIVGAGETALALASGIPAGAVNVGKTIQHGYANLAGAGDPNWREGMVSGYEPRTEEGRYIPEAISGGISALTEKAKSLLEEHGHPALAASVDPAMEIGSDVAQLLGTGALARGAISDVAKKAAAKTATRQELLDAERNMHPDDFKTLKDAMDAGFKVQKSMIPGKSGSYIEELAGKQGMASALSEANQPIVNSLAKEDLGIPETEAINSSAINRIKSDAYDRGYEPLKNYGDIKTNNEFMDAIDDIKHDEQLINQAVPELATDKISKIVDPLKKGSFDSNVMVTLIKKYRKEAKKHFSGSDPDLDIAHAYDKAANAMEQAIEDHLQSSGDTALLNNYRDARKQIAVAHMYDKSILQGSNNISAPALAREFQKGGYKYMSNNAPKIAAFANLYQKAVKSPSQIGQKSGSGLHTTIAAASGKDMPSAIKRTILGHYAPKIAQKAVLSDVYQSGLLPSETVNPSLLSRLPQTESPMNPAYALPGILNMNEDQQP